MKSKTILYVISLSTLLSGTEPSVYGAGDLNSPQPYGLTQTEQSVLDNRREVQLLKNKVDEQQSRIDGLTSIIEGLNQQIMQLREEMQSSSGQQNDYNQTYSLLLDLGNMIDQINSNYVTREELQAALQGKSISSVPKQQSLSQANSGSNDIASIYREGVQLFGRKSYNAAKEKFEQTVAQNYKAAASNYYLGEIAYYTDQYDSAVAYYKKSAGLYDKASYMAVLYLHTGISLSRIGESSQARDFFQYVIDNYPSTKSAEIARNNL